MYKVLHQKIQHRTQKHRLLRQFGKLILRSSGGVKKGIGKLAADHPDKGLQSEGFGLFLRDHRFFPKVMHSFGKKTEGLMTIRERIS